MNRSTGRQALLLALGCLLGSLALAQEARRISTPGEFVSAINQARARGCDGRAGVPGRLEHEARLTRAAERMSRGLDLAAALAAEGYRSQRAGVVALRGYSGPQGIAQGLGLHACTALVEPVWQHAGVHQQGEASWIILANPFSPPQPQDETQVRAEMLQLVNRARAQARRCGSQSFASAPPLQLNVQLHQAAEVHAADMAQHSYFSHTGRDGSQVGDRATRASYAWRRIGENLAAGQTTPQAAVQGWLASPGHCANLMQPAYTEMGLAYAVNPKSRDGIYWVQVLGTPR